MTLQIYEREDTFKSTVSFYSGSALVDPSGNLAYIDVYRPDNTLLLSTSGQKISTGIYYYYITTEPEDNMGIYTIDWWGSFYYDGLDSLSIKKGTRKNVFSW
jgi:hypothetical protein